MRLPVVLGNGINHWPVAVVAMAKSKPRFILERSNTPIGKQPFTLNFLMILVPIEGVQAVGLKGTFLEAASKG